MSAPSSTITVTNPYDLSIIGRVPLMSSAEVDQAIARARACFDDRGQWLPAHQRIAILEKTAQLMEGRKDELTRIACLEGGKPWKDSMVEVRRAIQGVKLAAEHVSQIKGEQVPMDHTEATTGRLAFSTREAIGVVSSISAFNHPLNLVIHQTAPALAVGAPVLIKPALNTPFSCINFVSILREAGLPDQWCQVLICENENAEQLVTDARVNFFSFIGSGKVGWHLRSKLAPGTRCALEHGGVAPAIVTADADLDVAVPRLLKGGFYHSGQVCVSVQRIYAHEDIIDELAKRMTIDGQKLNQGDPMDPATEVGSLISPQEVQRVSSWVDEAIEGGATLLLGGQVVSETAYSPTLLLNPPVKAAISTKEVFGPVICLYSYRSFDEAIEWANDLPFAFQASLFTRELTSALQGSTKLNATAVMINDHTAFRADWMPFGGRGESGLGLGGIPHSMHEMTQEKIVVINQS